MTKHLAYWIAAVLLAVLVFVKVSPQTGFTSLIRFGETWQERRHSALQGLPLATVSGSSGYDGQFYAQIALDPLLRGPELANVIDAPAYRARRILVPAAAFLLGLGNPWWTLQAFALLNVFCWFALGWRLHRLIGTADRFAFARWAGCMFSLGVLDSVRQSLVDLPALLLLVLATEAYAQTRAGRSTLWLALANLTKETSLLGALALQCDGTLRPFPWRRASLSLFAAVLPLALWSVYVQERFVSAPDSGGLGNFTWPFLGLVTQARDSLREVSLGNFDSRHSFSLIAIIGLLVQAWVVWRNPRLSSPWGRIGAAYSLLLIFLGSWVWSGYWAACRSVLPMTIAFNLLLPGARNFWPLWILGNLTVLHGVWRFL
ncbi:hypothetical protein [Opitutus sp. GAS368]|jgi:hypothetical protein|uniref:hypothetical protein n=1 Tax=Opitutus sp. GAS368 TaxID=1882749 RepID=UPI00087D6B04|nr:hypothetical protein [Opitutus sp. GAS368]SDS29741.1 hypothetical protein SAMN05444173_2464 [Opitutus sp. GAS368]